LKSPRHCLEFVETTFPFPGELQMPQIYTVVFTSTAVEAERLSRTRGVFETLCTNNCGTGSNLVIPAPGIGEGPVLIPAVRGAFVTMNSLAQTNSMLGAAADNTIAIQVTGFDPGHAVVVLLWEAAPPPFGITCVNCPPDTSVVSTATSVVPPQSNHVLSFATAAAADGWVASAAGQAYLANAVYIRLTLRP
jgi:hypothetical protein